ncbi:MAG TPA: PASTA domain-containing protein [Acidimicrobiales bacterium]|nr:PASTA domain-containing protein [Acidimicrobiales bacterium]
MPDVIGEPLSEAIATVSEEDLGVVGNGVPAGDPQTGDAVVIAQEPPPGSLVAVGACVGFRTRR